MSENFNRIMAGLDEVAEIAAGREEPARVCVPDDVDVKAIRLGLKMTQAEFAARFGFKKAAVTEWEQRRRRPEAAARVLLKIIAMEPEAVDRALASA